MAGLGPDSRPYPLHSHNHIHRVFRCSHLSGSLDHYAKEVVTPSFPTLGFDATPSVLNNSTMSHTYPNQQESLLAKVKGKTGKISDKTHEEHLKLYTGYVNKSNGILAELEKMGTPDPTNPAVVVAGPGPATRRDPGRLQIFLIVLERSEILVDMLENFVRGFAVSP